MLPAHIPDLNMLGSIGNTPITRLHRVVPENHADVYVKLECLNPTGSHKDRMAVAIIESAEDRGHLKPGMTVVEATGGSTGSSLAFVCAAKGYKFRAVSSDAFASEKLATMSAFGASLELIQSPGKITKDLISSVVARARQLAQEENTLFTDQLNNSDALHGYRKLGLELLSQLPEGIDCFCTAVGTAGMAMGVAGVLKSWSASDRVTRVVVLEPESSPFLTRGFNGTHTVEGTGIGFTPPLLQVDLFDEARAISETEARAMCRRPAQEEGLLVVVSTGINVVAAIQLARELGAGKTVVTVACDNGLKYMNGNLFSVDC